MLSVRCSEPVCFLAALSIGLPFLVVFVVQSVASPLPALLAVRGSAAAPSLTATVDLQRLPATAGPEEASSSSQKENFAELSASNVLQQRWLRRLRPAASAAEASVAEMKSAIKDDSECESGNGVDCSLHALQIQCKSGKTGEWQEDHDVNASAHDSAPTVQGGSTDSNGGASRGDADAGAGGSVDAGSAGPQAGEKLGRDEKVRDTPGEGESDKWSVPVVRN
eukprot:TRINITY_DN108736_c0_g1_i1.p1 TRINITY_DN108736_c0_g1~~TRINITY_DN108736_c0_g1_i1.p1  ORF type:complete len:223 (-),score=52.08 TRINITY_DN108736_c0_g1_i1:459-1127(-)